MFTAPCLRFLMYAYTHREGHTHSNTNLFDLSEFLEIDDTADCATETADAADAVLENPSGACGQW